MWIVDIILGFLLFRSNGKGHSMRFVAVVTAVLLAVAIIAIVLQSAHG